MKTMIIKSNRISLPLNIVRKFEGREVEIIETREGVLLRPVENAIKSTRGFLKGKGSFSSGKYLNLKQKEKELE
jgi:hypothetical protein